MNKECINPSGYQINEAPVNCNPHWRLFRLPTSPGKPGDVLVAEPDSYSLVWKTPSWVPEGGTEGNVLTKTADGADWKEIKPQKIDKEHLRTGFTITNGANFNFSVPAKSVDPTGLVIVAGTSRKTYLYCPIVLGDFSYKTSFVLGQTYVEAEVSAFGFETGNWSVTVYFNVPVSTGPLTGVDIIVKYTVTP